MKKYIKYIITITFFILLHTFDAKAQDKANMFYNLRCIDVGVTSKMDLSRCENAEVICYMTHSYKVMQVLQCKFK